MSEMMKMLSCLLVVLMGMRTPLYAENRSAEDSLSVHTSTSFRPAQLIVPGAMIGVGAFGIASGCLRDASHTLDRNIKRWSDGRKCKADEYLRFLPSVAYVGLEYLGAKPKHSLCERLAVGVVSTLATEAMVGGLKAVVKETRPDNSARNSFPSGHSAIAFMGAELVRMEYGTWFGMGAYTVATGVAVLRLYNGKHWAHDVLAGAGFGILGAKIGYWSLPLMRKWLKLRPRTAVAVTPYYNRDTRSGGGAVAIVF